MKTLDEVRAFIAAEAVKLDPQSRYIAELLAVVNGSANVQDFFAKLDAGCRGAHWAGRNFTTMTPQEKVRCNLITNETSLMRFDSEELSFLRQTILPAIRRKNRHTNILCLPCSHGEEAVSLASECRQLGFPHFTVHGIDIQPACIAMAKSGTLPYPGLPLGVQCKVTHKLLRKLNFRVADVFTDDIGGPYDLVVCRNFLGYFTPPFVRQVLVKLCAALTPNDSFLMVDHFILGKHPETFERLPLQRIPDMPVFCSFGP